MLKNRMHTALTTETKRPEDNHKVKIKWKCSEPVLELTTCSYAYRIERNSGNAYILTQPFLVVVIVIVVFVCTLLSIFLCHYSCLSTRIFFILAHDDLLRFSTLNINTFSLSLPLIFLNFNNYCRRSHSVSHALFENAENVQFLVHGLGVAHR